MITRYQPEEEERMHEDKDGDYVAYEGYEAMVNVMNPCKHTGFEAAPCDICGYPDPRKVLARLRTSRDEWRRIAVEANNRFKVIMGEAGE